MFASVFAWIAYRTDTPGRKIFDYIPILVFMVPSILFDIGWVFLLSPKIGLINLFLIQTFGLTEAPLDIYTIWGMTWSQAVTTTPLAYLLISGAFSTMDPSLEEVAQLSGAGKLRLLRTITLPLLYPTMVATAAINFMIGLSSFETPVILGLPGKVKVYMSTIYEQIQIAIPPNYGLATSLAFVSVAIASVVLAFYLYSTRKLSKYVVITGKGYRPGVVGLGRAKYLTFAFVVCYLIIGIVLPLAMNFMVSLVPFYTVTQGNPFAEINLKNYIEAVSSPFIVDAVVNSLLLAFGSALLAILLASLLSYAAIRSTLKGKRFFEVVGVMPSLYPGVVFSLAMLWASITVYRPIYGTIWVLVMAYIVVLLPRAMRAISNSMIQLHPELEEGARVSGATWSRTFRTVTLPILRPALLNSFALSFIQAYQTLGPAVLLITPGTIILPALILRLWVSGQLVQLAAASMIFGGLGVMIVLAAKYIFRMKL